LQLRAATGGGDVGWLLAFRIDHVADRHCIVEGFSRFLEGIHPENFSGFAHQRPPGISGIDRRLGLNHICSMLIACRLPFVIPSKLVDQPLGIGPGFASRMPNGMNVGANLNFRLGPEFKRTNGGWSAGNRDNGEITDVIQTRDLADKDVCGVYFRAFLLWFEYDPDLFLVADDMSIGQNAVGAQITSGAEAGIGRHHDHRRRRGSIDFDVPQTANGQRAVVRDRRGQPFCDGLAGYPIRCGTIPVARLGQTRRRNGRFWRGRTHELVRGGTDRLQEAERCQHPHVDIHSISPIRPLGLPLLFRVRPFFGWAQQQSGFEQDKLRAHAEFAAMAVQ
jgi:hypothetical protein